MLLARRGFKKRNLLKVGLQNTENGFKRPLTIRKGTIGTDQNMLSQMPLNQFGHQPIERPSRRGHRLKDHRVILIPTCLQKLFNARKLTLNSPDTVDQIFLLMNRMHSLTLL